MRSNPLAMPLGVQTDDALGLDQGMGLSQIQNGVQLIAFSVDGQMFAVEIMSVREIRAWSGATPLPNTAEFVKGVINLRGSIIPIIDLRTRIGGGATKTTKTHVVIVLMIGTRLAGILVDAVYDILNVSRDDFQDMPDDPGGSAGILKSLVPYEEKMVGLVRLEKIFAGAIAAPLGEES